MHSTDVVFGRSPTKLRHYCVVSPSLCSRSACAASARCEHPPHPLSTPTNPLWNAPWGLACCFGDLVVLLLGAGKRPDSFTWMTLRGRLMLCFVDIRQSCTLWCVLLVTHGPLLQTDLKTRLDPGHQGIVYHQKLCPPPPPPFIEFGR